MTSTCSSDSDVLKQMKMLILNGCLEVQRQVVDILWVMLQRMKDVGVNRYKRDGGLEQTPFQFCCLSPEFGPKVGYECLTRHQLCE